METNVEDLKNIAETVAVEAAELVEKAYNSMRRGENIGVSTKTTPTDVVTATDVETEQFIRRRLGELRPGDIVVGEEHGGQGGDGVNWIVDPIDGTVNFLYGLPWFSVSIGAQIAGQSVAGAVVEPVSGRRWTAALHEGSWLNGERLTVSHPTELELTLVGTGFVYDVSRRRRQSPFVSELITCVRDIRRSGSASLDLCSVAAGWLDAYSEVGLHTWDWAAGALIAREAGAHVLLPGEDLELGTDVIFAAAPSIVEPLRTTLIECGVADL